MSYRPYEMDYTPSDQPRRWVKERMSQFQNSPKQVYNDTSRELRFTLVEDQFIDLSSLRLEATMEVDGWLDMTTTNRFSLNGTFGGFTRDGSDDFNLTSQHSRIEATEIDVLTADTREITRVKTGVVSGMSFFESLEIRSGNGTIIERITDGVALGEIYRSMNIDRDWGSTQQDSFLCDQNDRKLFLNWDRPIPDRLTEKKGGLFNQTFDFYDQDEANRTFWGPEYQRYKRRLTIPALSLLGFLNTGKWVNPSVYGGLIILLKFAPSASLFHTKHLGSPNLRVLGNGFLFNQKVFEVESDAPVASDAAKLAVNTFRDKCLKPTASFRDVTLRYDVINPTREYLTVFNQRYLQGGFRIEFDTLQGESIKILKAGEAVRQIELPVVGKRVKGLMFILRQVKHLRSHAYSEIHFEGGKFTGLTEFDTGFNNANMETYQPNYQLVIGSTRYPQSPIDSYSKAFREYQKTAYGAIDRTKHGTSYSEFANSYSQGEQTLMSTLTAVYSEYGKFVGCVDLEHFNTNRDSGVEVLPNTMKLYTNWDISRTSSQEIRQLDPDKNSHITSDTLLQLNAYTSRAQSVTVINGRVIVDF